MPRRVFEEEAGLYEPAVLQRGKADLAGDQPLEGLPAPSVLLFETGQALAAALMAGIGLALLSQWIGLR